MNLGILYLSCQKHCQQLIRAFNTCPNSSHQKPLLFISLQHGHWLECSNLSHCVSPLTEPAVEGTFPTTHDIPTGNRFSLMHSCVKNSFQSSLCNSTCPQVAGYLQWSSVSWITYGLLYNPNWVNLEFQLICKTKGVLFENHIAVKKSPHTVLSSYQGYNFLLHTHLLLFSTYRENFKLPYFFSIKV